MYRVTKTMEIAGAHQLKLDYESKCSNLHGHNWIITVTCESDRLNKNGMVVDFKHIKNMVADKLDHKNINEVEVFKDLGINPTAENIARWICDIVPNCVYVAVQESEGNLAEYFKERVDEDCDRAQFTFKEVLPDGC